MLRIWNKYSISEALKEAYEKGIVLSGLSAGSICWYESGHSDSDRIENGQESSYTQIKGLGFIPGFHCPHHNEGDRSEDFDKMLLKTGYIGIAVENNCAIEYLDDFYKIIKADDNAKAYKIYRRDKCLVREELTNIDEYRKIELLLTI